MPEQANIAWQVSQPLMYGNTVPLYIEPVDCRRTCGRFEKSQQHAQQCGFAGAVGAKQPKDFTTCNVQVTVFDGSAITESLSKFVGLDEQGEQFVYGMRSRSVNFADDSVLPRRTIGAHVQPRRSAAKAIGSVTTLH